MKIKETDIAKGAALWLESRGLEVFQEVRGPKTDKRVDLVGREMGTIVCVEAKVSLGLAVITQANYWLGRASETWVAVPVETVRRAPTFTLARELCADHGIGILSVYLGSDGVNVGVTVELEAVVNGQPMHDWNARLHPEQKDSQGGSSGGGYSTDFSRTCASLVEVIRKHGGAMPLKSAMRETDHHYSRLASAVSSLSGNLNVQGRTRSPHLSKLRIEGKGTKAMVYLNEPEDF